MTQLLVSVRSVEEFQLVADAGVRYIDIKEPRLGSLGAASLDIISGIAAVVQPKHHLSIALGELLDAPMFDPQQVPPRTNLVKWGLSECASRPNWQTELRDRMASLPPQVGVVAVAYADWKTARAPQFEAVVEAGQELQCEVLLIDTFCKRHGNLLQHLTLADLDRVIETARAAGMKVALAGSLDHTAIAQLRNTRAGIFAVRTAVCQGARSGELNPHAVRELASSLSL